LDFDGSWFGFGFGFAASKVFADGRSLPPARLPAHYSYQT
jgi:hypothetical protein